MSLKVFMDVMRKDMQVVDVTEEDVVDRKRWRQLTRCGNPYHKKLKEEVENIYIKIILVT